MTDDLDGMLRDHYRRAAERIEPDAALIARARNARTAPQEARWRWPLAVAAATAMVLIAVSAIVARPAGTQTRPLAPATTPSQALPSPSMVPVDPTPARHTYRPPTGRPLPIRTPSVPSTRAVPTPTRAVPSPTRAVPSLNPITSPPTPSPTP